MVELTGRVFSAAATITTFASAVGGAKPGDVGIELDAKAAAHIQQLMLGSDTSNCDVGDDFFDSYDKRALDMADVLCGAQNLMSDAIRREGIADYLLVNPARLPWTEADVVAAVNRLVQWSLAQAAILNPGVGAAQLRFMAVGAFGLSFAYYFNGAITSNNIIPGASLKGGPEATECPLETATKCGVGCGVFAWAPQFECTTTCSTITSCDAQDEISTTLISTFPTFSHAATGTAVPTAPLQYGSSPKGEAVKPGTELRILPVGDSITVGWESNNKENGVAGDGNGYRLELRNDLSSEINPSFVGSITID